MKKTLRALAVFAFYPKRVTYWFNLLFLIFFCTVLAACGGGGGGDAGGGSTTAPDSPDGGSSTPPLQVNSFFGTAPKNGYVDGTGSDARFYRPFGGVSDGSFLYIADADNHTIRKIDLVSTEVTTLAGTVGVPGSDDGTGTTAKFNQPTRIAHFSGQLYISDSGNHTIRQLNLSTGVVTTLAGTAGTTGSTDGVGTAALFSQPNGIAIDSTGTHLYVADSLNSTIRKIVITTATVSTLAGTAGSLKHVDGVGAAARFSGVYGLTFDNGNLYATDSVGHTVRKVVIATATVSTLAGTASTTGTTDGTGTAARFNGPVDVTSDGTNLYVVDGSNHTIRRIVIATAVVTTFAGSAGTRAVTNGVGTAAAFDAASSVILSGTDLYVPEVSEHHIRKIEIGTATVSSWVGP